tara:strand:+ start:12598 stop:13347 length:750 start_codon:yes stop_codon:yes gene_type:complete
MRNNLYNTKAGFEVKDMDEGKREVSVYLSKFDTMDSDNDVIKKGSFAKSIQERGVASPSNRKIAFLRHHDWQKPIGKFLALEEDELGLFAVGKLGRSTDGEDAYRDYEDGIIKEHSIGFQYIGDKMRFIEDKNMDGGGYYEITELKLFEGSAVTFGANEFTNVVDVKSSNKKAFIEKLNDDLNLCVKALLNGKGTDERLYEIEMKVKHLTSQIVLLNTDESAPSHSKIIEPEATKQFEWSQVIKGLEAL